MGKNVSGREPLKKDVQDTVTLNFKNTKILKEERI